MAKARQNIQIMLSSDAISNRVAELARLIEADYANKELVAVGLLKGAYCFMADLVRAVDLDMQIGFLAASSYGSGQASSGDVKILQEIDCHIQGKDVLIVEDIVDTGQTIEAVTKHLHSYSPASLRVCTLLDKPSRRKVNIRADYVGFAIEDYFAVGYGMDVGGKYRDLPYVGKYSG
ncbi:MAG: hypoxanthine phosphoribosyltransferase [Holophagaceae bacterium]|nr:hypoxanthine phosphoribosyltransferase [Holophagaceae bacterium]